MRNLAQGIRRGNHRGFSFTAAAALTLARIVAARIMRDVQDPAAHPDAVATALDRMPEVYRQIVGLGGPGMPLVTSDMLMEARRQHRFCGIWPIC